MAAPGDESSAAGESVMGITRMAGDTMSQEQAMVDDGTMDEVVEKLKILDYQTAFAKEWAGASKYGHQFKPLNRTLFTLSDGTGQQSFYFTSLVAWLVELCGGRFAKFDQYQEDPNVTATNIVQALKELRLETKDVLPSKLVKGYGDSVLLTLNMLCDEALKAKGFQFLVPDYPHEAAEDLDLLDEQETGDDEIADDVAAALDSDDDEWQDHGGKHTRGEEENAAMIESQVNPEKWRLELETVAAQLKLSAQETMKDWRGHVEYISAMLKKLDSIFPEARQSLHFVKEDIQRAVDKIQKREVHFAQQFQDTVERYRELHSDLSALQKNYDDSQQGVSQQTTKLNQLTEDLDHVKNEIQEREDQMSDSKPLVNIKRALSDLKVEIKNMELRIGVLQHTVLHQTISNTSQKQKPDENNNNSFAESGEVS
eukprot:TRINITY_DN60461_c0_g1_i1.p1 TRINITY_DN60461_c0_g1~~TRINITY_DN60461_c0_g1_i1.p1  ORF type:complete len:427 (+),score=194.36 TRINITY_DN60461_c0_g1_i1:91-1371(+)